MQPKIKTFNPRPPIPERSFDWVAYYDDDANAGLWGYGSTEQVAIDDLVMLTAENK